MLIGSLFSEEFYHVYAYVTTGFACVSNVYLIYILIITKVKHVGQYRFLLLSFAVVDILISIVHFILIPGIHMTEFGFIFWGYRLLDLPTAQGDWMITVWCLLFYQTFVLLAFHYVYRFVLICTPRWLDWIQRNPRRNWIAIAVVVDLMELSIIYVLCAQLRSAFRSTFAPVMMPLIIRITDLSLKMSGYEHRAGIRLWSLRQPTITETTQELYHIDLLTPMNPGFFGIVYWQLDESGVKQWNARSLIAIASASFCFVFSVCLIIFCLTLIPTLTSYIPIGFIFAAPLMTDIAFGGLGTILIMSTQIFPMVDLFLVLFFIKSYRKALPKFLQKAPE